MSALVLSLDFELRWGVYDVYGLDWSAYRANLEGVREVVPRLLEAFERSGTRATWATVGALACESWDEYNARAPHAPLYTDASLRFPREAERHDPAGRLHFAPDLVAAIVKAPGQELGSHTFSHLYCAEAGVEAADFDRDGEAVAALFESKWGVRPTSFVYPRNQVRFAERLPTHGIRTWRDNPDVWFWAPTPGAFANRPTRLARAADSLVPLGVHASRRAAAQRASFFVRFGLPAPLWRLHRERIARAATRVPEGSALHLWWHPHNLGAAPARNVARAVELLDAIHEATRGTLESRTMSEWAA